MDFQEHINYADAGVDIDEGERAVEAIKPLVAATSRSEVIGGLGGFGSLFSLAHIKDMEDPVLVSGTDGVGTKLAIAQMLNRNRSVGKDLVAMCADDVVVVGAEPLFFLDYVSIGKLSAEVMKDIVFGIAEGCKEAGCALVGGEMAEHPGVMAEDDYDLAGFVVGVVDRGRMLGAHLVKEHDVIIGLPSSGIHSNGYSLVRKAVVEKCSIEELNEARKELDGKSLADALLEPTTIYAGKLLAALKEGAPVHAMAHITGGGISDNLNRILPSTLDALVYRGIKDGGSWADKTKDPAWKIPAIINYIVKAANLTPDEAYRTFNMGVGMSLVSAPEDVDTLCSILKKQGFAPFVMGECVRGTGKVIYQ